MALDLKDLGKVGWTQATLQWLELESAATGKSKHQILRELADDYAVEELRKHDLKSSIRAGQVRRQRTTAGLVPDERASKS